VNRVALAEKVFGKEQIAAMPLRVTAISAARGYHSPCKPLMTLVAELPLIKQRPELESLTAEFTESIRRRSLDSNHRGSFYFQLSRVLAALGIISDEGGVKSEVQHLSRMRCRNARKNQYQQLQPEERLTIASLHLQGSSIRAMARILGRSPATVSRELTRNSSAVGYASLPAQALSVARRSAGRRPIKLCLQSVCWRIVLTLLEWKWSPQQISGTLKRMYPTDSTQHVSHETIYTTIYPHRMACARYDFHVPKESSRADLIQSKTGMIRMLQEIPLTDNERAAVEGDHKAMDRLLQRLETTPTPDRFASSKSKRHGLKKSLDST
jgi:hypothetical protein